jgi:putative Holliday junction resolvase
LVSKIAEKQKEYGADLIVVGLPKNMNGSIGDRAEECKEIAEKIGAATNTEIVLWDERCTTVSAHTALNFTDTRGKKRKDIVDAVAAVIILEDYLTYRKNTSGV